MTSIQLNSDQEEIATIIIDKLSKGDQILAFVSGRAGTGKSALIRYITSNLKDLNTIVCAFTNQAAKNVGGRTIHSAFMWTQWDMNCNLGADANYCDLIIIDEVSMISSKMLAAMDLSLRRIAGTRKVFGGKSILAFGDFNQLPPVLATPVYKSFLWKFFQRNTFCLTKNMRQDQREFDAACLYYILRGEVSPVLRSRIDNRPIATITNEMTDEEVRATSFLFYRNDDVDAQNMRVVKKLKHVPVMCKNVTTTGGLTKTKEDTFFIGARYTARDCSRAFIKRKDGTKIKGKIYKGSLYILVEMKGYYAKLIDAEENEYEIYAEKNLIKHKPLTYNQSMPLILAYASTVHKAQGSSFDAVVVDPVAMSRQLFYVAISRCRKLERLIILGRIPIGVYDAAKIEEQVYNLQVETPPDVDIQGPDETE